MQADWLATLRENSELATKMAREMPSVMFHPHVTLLQVTRLFQALEGQIQGFERLRAQMDREGADESLLELADTIQGAWDELGEALAKRLLELREID